MKKKMKVFLVAMLLMALTACGKSTVDRWQEQYDLGEQYLLEEDYEAAIVAFTAAIEIEPRDERGYIGKATAEYRLGRLDDAVETLNTGIEMVEDSTNLQALLDEILAEQDAAASEEDAEEEVVPTSFLLVTENWYYQDQLQWTKEYSYDEKGLLVEAQNLGAEGNVIYTYLYTCDEAGNQLKSETIDADGNTSNMTEQTFDADGNVLTQISYSQSLDGGELILSMTNDYEYDEDGNLTKWVYFNGNGTFTWTYAYDEEGKCLYEYFGTPDDFQYVQVNTYDSQGGVIQEDLYHSWDEEAYKTTTYSCTYDDAGNVLTKDSDSGGHYEYSYDSEGRITSSIYDTGSSRTATYYHYDEYGNLIFEGDEDANWTEYVYTAL